MDLEEREGVEPLQQQCQSCGTRLTAAELQAALESESDVFLCSRCAAEQVPVGDEFSDEA
jgi:recombinational DNA repair protein (RecF pathway)